MTPDALVLLIAAIFIVAMLYSGVGHGGASGYIATLALFGLAPAVFKPTALILNIVVATIGAVSFARAGHFSWRLFWPFAATSIPFSFLGGFLGLPSHIYKPLIGVILLFSALRLIFHKETEALDVRRPSVSLALPVGAALGFLSGLTGVGGGIFLSPLLMLLRWGRAREVSGVAALFILVNSSAALASYISSIQQVPSFAPFVVVAALAGGFLGSYAGSRHLPVGGVVKALVVVLAIAGFKLLFV